MKLFKKIAAFFVAAALAVTALPMVASAADDWKAKTKTALNGKEYSFTLPDNQSDSICYKVTLKEAGYLVLDVQSTASITDISIAGDGFFERERFDYELSFVGFSGSNSRHESYMKWDSSAKKAKATFSKSLSKGTYSILFYRGEALGTGKVKFTAHYYDKDSVFCNSKTASSGKTYTSDLNVEGSESVYKFNVAKSGNLKVKVGVGVDGEGAYSNVITAILYKGSDDNDVEISSMNVLNGSHYSNNDIYAGVGCNTTAEINYKVSKGTYYLRLSKNSSNTASVSMTATYPEGSSNDGKISYLSLTMSKGSSIQLGTVMSVDGAVTWTSSKTSVATVSSNGKITAKSKGSAVITAKSGKNSVKIKITVV